MELRAAPLLLHFAVGQGELRSKRRQPGLGRSYGVGVCTHRGQRPLLHWFVASSVLQSYTSATAYAVVGDALCF